MSIERKAINLIELAHLRQWSDQTETHRISQIKLDQRSDITVQGPLVEQFIDSFGADHVFYQFDDGTEEHWHFNRRPPPSIEKTSCVVVDLGVESVLCTLAAWFGRKVGETTTPLGYVLDVVSFFGRKYGVRPRWPA